MPDDQLAAGPPWCPDVTISTAGIDSYSVPALIGLGVKGLRDAGYDDSMVEQYVIEATQLDYDTVLATTARWFVVDQ